MKKYKIAILKGDGIGPEIVNEAMKVLKKVSKKFMISFEFKEALIGGIAIDKTGVPLPDETIELCKKSDAVVLGAVGGYKWDSLPIRPEAGLLRIRSVLGLYSNFRPAIIFEPLKSISPLKEEIIGNSLNIMVVRELTGGIYFGKHGRDENSAFDTESYTVDEIERVARTAFKIASKRHGKLCSVDKANVLESSKLWRETIIKISKDYPEICLTHMYVDNCAMQLIRNPRQFDVIVTSNMFGDILSDEASMLSGSIGMLPSASLSDSSPGLYEPIHGSAPDIAGKNIANPLAAILSASMMLRYSFFENEAADRINFAVNEILKSARTDDIYEDGLKKVSTSEMGSLVADLI